MRISRDDRDVLILDNREMSLLGIDQKIRRCQTYLRFLLGRFLLRIAHQSGGSYQRIILLQKLDTSHRFGLFDIPILFQRGSLEIARLCQSDNVTHQTKVGVDEFGICRCLLMVNRDDFTLEFGYIIDTIPRIGRNGIVKLMDRDNAESTCGIKEDDILKILTPGRKNGIISMCHSSISFDSGVHDSGEFLIESLLGKDHDVLGIRDSLFFSFPDDGAVSLRRSILLQIIQIRDDQLINLLLGIDHSHDLLEFFGKLISFLNILLMHITSECSQRHIDHLMGNEGIHPIEFHQLILSRFLGRSLDDFDDLLEIGLLGEFDQGLQNGDSCIDLGDLLIEKSTDVFSPVINPCQKKSPDVIVVDIDTIGDCPELDRDRLLEIGKLIELRFLLQRIIGLMEIETVVNVMLLEFILGFLGKRSGSI